jgi:hypothetical protein
MDQYEAMNAALDARLLPWIGRAANLITARVADARAHVDRAITDTLKDTPDGRPTVLKAQRSPSYQAALNRLDELRVDLIGPATNALTGLLRDARAAFYRDSVELWKRVIPPENRRVPDPQPTDRGEAIVRGAIIHGLDLYREIVPGFIRVRNNLFAAVNGAGRTGSHAKSSKAIVDRWEKDTRDHLVKRAMSSLSDSDKAIHETTGRLMVRDPGGRKP